MSPSPQGTLKVLYHLLEMSATGIFNVCALPVGVAGAQSTVALSLDRDTVPSCFLYEAEALNGAVAIVLGRSWRMLRLRSADVFPEAAP